MAKIPVGKITEKESQKLSNLEAILHKRIIGQDEAITQISRAMRRSRSGIETGGERERAGLDAEPGRGRVLRAEVRIYIG